MLHHMVRSREIAFLLLSLPLACAKRSSKEPADPCPPVSGQMLPVQAVRMHSTGDSPQSGVITTESELRATRYTIDTGAVALRPGEPEPKVDFAKQRLAYVVLRQRPNATVPWVVETPTEIVVGVRVDAYCGGAAPPDGVAAVLLPASSKTVRFATCSVGSCDPSVLAP